jgi:hypothetical protein
VKEVRTSDKEKRRQYRIIYQLIYDNPRILPQHISREIGTGPKTTSKRMGEAFDEGYIMKPQIRKRSYSNRGEYVYLVNCEDPLELYLQYCEDQNVAYLAAMDGVFNLCVVSKEKMVIEGDLLVGGLRSDYHVSFAPNHSWNTAIDLMWEKARNFNPEDYQPKGIMKNHWDETIKWTKEDEILYRYFKYNLRKPLTPIIKNYRIYRTEIKRWLQRLPECCTVFTRYFPETIESYDPYMFAIETDYEDFIIDLFSELPTSSIFFKVSNKLLMYADVDRRLLRSAFLKISEVSKIHIPFLLRDLKKKGIIKSKGHAIVAHHYKKEI